MVVGMGGGMSSHRRGGPSHAPTRPGLVSSPTPPPFPPKTRSLHPSFVLGLVLPSLIVLRARLTGRPLMRRSTHKVLRALAHPVMACACLALAVVAMVLSALSAAGVLAR